MNVDVPTTGIDLIHLAAHEVYPGHHTEHAVKEQLLARDRGAIEESMQLVPTPQAVLSEGIAETGGDFLSEETRAAAYDVLRRHGIEVNPELGERVSKALEPLRTVGLDAALMIHQHAASHDEAQAYIERWSLVPPEQAKHSVSFATDPTWRAVRRHLLGRPRSLPGLRRRRPSPLHPAADRTRPDRRPARNGVLNHVPGCAGTSS